MTKMTKLNKLALALVTAGLMGAGTGAAQAGALATSTLRMTDFLLLHSDGSTFDASDFNPLVPASSANIAATYNGVGSTDAGGPSATGQINLLPTCQGPGCPGVVDNVFPNITNPPVSLNFVAADQNESGAPISGLDDGAGGTLSTGATVESGSWAILKDPSAGPNTASATNQLSSTWLFSLGNADSLTFAFHAALYQESFTSADQVFPASAQTSSQFFITVTNQDTGAVVFDWSPNGVSGDGIGVLTETDPFNLNAGTARSAPFNGTSLLPGEVAGTSLAGDFSGTTSVLSEGTVYRLEATLKTTAAGVSATSVPEPGMLSLLGIGLLGLGGARKLRRSRA